MLFPYISLECLLKYTLFSKSVKLCKKCIDRWTHSLTQEANTTVFNASRVCSLCLIHPASCSGLQAASHYASPAE